MEFTYGTLKSADQNGNRIGNWKGRPVFASSKNGLKNRCIGVYYIVYDDNNVLVRRNEDNDKWYKYGWVSRSGNVNEETVVEYMKKPQAPKYTPAFIPAAAEEKKKKEEAPQGIVGDFMLETSVEEMLEAARNMTLDDLLEGFNYGLD